MKIVMSPAKKMKIDEDCSIMPSSPIFLKQSIELREKLKAMSYENLHDLWKTSDRLTLQCYEELHHPIEIPTCALFAYDGIAFQYMHPLSLDEEEINYLKAHLRILSSLYGLLSPTDGIIPYRLEMGSHCPNLNLYDYWNHQLYEALNDSVIINLASQEYARCLSPYLKEEDQWIDVKFLRNKKGKLQQQATYAKMARGAMVAYMAKEKIETPEGLKGFQDLGFSYDESLSNELCYVFVQREEKE